jgi:chaperone required for assembly of F1-ATPase
MEKHAEIMKRFWKNASVETVGDAYAIRLDARPVKTPMRADLLLPNVAMAQAICAEWNAVGDDIDPLLMPITGLANAAIDRIAADRDGFVSAIAAYGESDLFCYRAEEPDILVQRQADIWDRYLRWAQARYFVTFTVVTGIMHQPQPAATLARLKAAVAELNQWQLAAASKMVPITGSLIALLALLEGEVTAAALWPDLVLDELWQEEKWGADDFALKNRRDREADFMGAARFLDYSEVADL